MTNKYLLSVVAIVCLFLLSYRLSANPSTTITVGGADTVRTESVVSSLTLNSLIAGVQDRLIVQYSNTIRHIGLINPPASLSTKLAAVRDRVIVQYGNTIRHVGLAAPSSPLQSHLGTVADRIIFQYANTNRALTLSYPRTLINDTTPPKITAPTVSPLSRTSIRLSWSSDEFTRVTIRYGSQSGSYPNEIVVASYAKNHAVTLSGLSGDAVYYRVTSTDLSGNTSVSPVYSYNLQQPLAPRALYLPLVTR